MFTDFVAVCVAHVSWNEMHRDQHRSSVYRRAPAVRIRPIQYRFHQRLLIPELSDCLYRLTSDRPSSLLRVTGGYSPFRQCECG